MTRGHVTAVTLTVGTVLAAGLLTAYVGSTSAAAATDSPMRGMTVGVVHDGAPMAPCEFEDSSGPCYWDATERGNGSGLSFIVTDDGTVVHVEGASW